MRKFIFYTINTTAFCFLALNIFSQNFNLVKDLNASRVGNPANDIYNLYIGFRNDLYIYGNTGNSKFAVLKGVAYFSADDGIHGTELWRSDNTAGGTYMVKDINTGSNSSSIQSITVVGNKIFFTADRILYESDGTEAGTIPVPGITYTGDITTCLTPVGNTLYFITNISRLWKTDGTASGTSLIIDFRTKYVYPRLVDFLGQLTNVNGILFFTSGLDNSFGAELWKSDGTEAGTVMVKDIFSGPSESRPSRLTVLNGKLYFVANDNIGIHLWVSDGTTNGTKEVQNNSNVILKRESISDNLDRLDISPIPTLRNSLYFKGSTTETGYELYKYDDSNPSKGIVLVKEFAGGAEDSDPSNLITVDTTLYFSITHPRRGLELWKTDGTKSKTTLVKNMGQGVSEYFSEAASINGKLLFAFKNTNTGYELWKSDGTENGTVLVKDIYPGYHGSSPTSITYLKNGYSLFAANDGSKGIELWRTNGDASGTAIIKNINTNTTSSSNLDLYYTSVYFNNKLFFNAYTPEFGNNLYSSDGTANGTQLIKDINSGNSTNPANLTIFKGNIYFSADSAGYNSIYKTDGTATGTIKLFSLEKLNTTVKKIAASKNYLYIFYYDLDSSNVQLWVTDGSTAGFQKIQNLIPQPSYNAVGVGNDLYFSGYDSTHGSEVWKVTKIPGSAKMVKDIRVGALGSNPNSLIEYNNKAYFQASDSIQTNIYVSDGTKVGTKKLLQGRSMIKFKDKLYLSGFNNSELDFNVGQELFVSDGTAEGTTLLKDINPGFASSSPSDFTIMNDTLYFSAYTETYDRELWRTDGTSNGTTLVKDVLEGSDGSYPYYFTAASNRLYFSSYDKLFVSDGTELGTKEINDFALAGVKISNFIVGGNTLFINGYTYALGNELYAGKDEGSELIAKNSISSVINKQNISANIIGNPVQSILKINITIDKSQQALITITDASGKVLMNKKQELNAGNNLLIYPTANFTAGIYNIKISVLGNEKVLTFVK